MEIQVHSVFVELCNDQSEDWCRLTILCEAAALGLWQRRCVQSQIGAASAQGSSTKQIAALRLLLFWQLFKHLTQVRQAKINLPKQEIE